MIYKTATAARYVLDRTLNDVGAEGWAVVSVTPCKQRVFSEQLEVIEWLLVLSKEEK
jgi:hypothetical protein